MRRAAPVAEDGGGDRPEGMRMGEVTDPYGAGFPRAREEHRHWLSDGRLMLTAMPSLPTFSFFFLCRDTVIFSTSWFHRPRRC